MKLNGTHKHFVYADDVNILGGSVHTIKVNTESLSVGSKEFGLEVSADNTKYKVMYRDQNAGRSHDIKIDNSSFERVDDIKYLGKTLAYQNSIQEQTKSTVQSGNACYDSVLNLLPSSLLSRNNKD